MDPLRNNLGGLPLFRSVPMTHLSRTPENSWSASLSGAGRATPTASVSDPLHRGSTMLTRADPHASGETPDNGGGGNSSVDNLRKWQQFGLRVTAADLPQSPSPLQQSASASWQRADTAAPIHYSQNLTQRQEEARSAPAQRESSDVEGRLAARHTPMAYQPSKTTSSTAETHTRAKNLTVVEVDVDGDDDSRDGSRGWNFTTTTPPPSSAQDHRIAGRSLRGTRVAPDDRSPSSPTPAAPPLAALAALSSSSLPAPADAAVNANRADPTAANDAARRLQRTLAQLSEKVQHSTEEQRCGPPKRAGGGSGGGGNPPSWAAKRWGGKKKAKAAKATAARDVGDENSDGDATNDENSVLSVPDVEQRAVDGASGDAASKQRKTKKGSRKGEKADGGAASTSSAAKKKGGKRKRDGGSDGDFANVPGSFYNAPRTLFSFGAGGGSAAGAMAGLSGVPTAAATVSVPFFYLQTTAEELFSDVRRTLNDPDRIQAPPLFVGLSTLGSDGGLGAPLVECRTNFTYHGGASKAGKGRASSCFSGIDPVYSHQHVELIMARWKDAVYALPAQTLGFPFLCRVLTELPGVEVITFNAPAVLVALLAHCKGTLWSQCISDVRVMAWMAQLHIGAATPASSASVLAAPQRAAFAAGADGGNGAAVADADLNVLYDYDQLLLRVSAGKLPPSVVLERASEADAYSAGSSFHATGGAFTAAPSSAEAPAPPLTPAQRLLAQQVYYLATVYRSLYGLLGSKGLLQAFLRQEKRIALLLALMRYNGVGVDLTEVHRYQKACETEMTRQRSLAASLVPDMGDDFNIQSHDQCRRALYEVLQLGRHLTAKVPGGGEAAAGSGLTITKGGRLSTAEDTLRALAPHHEFPACLLKYRKASKLMQTYVEGMMGYAIVRQEQACAGSAAAAAAGATASDTTSPTRPQANSHASPRREPQLLGETVDANDAGHSNSNPFVDQQLNAGIGSGGGGRRGRSVTSPGNANARVGVDEEASVTAVGDLTLPGRGYATIHPNFLQEGTDTGRLSCVEPNLQNLPRNGATAVLSTDGEEGEEDLLGFRRCFVAPPGSTLLSVDYQQIELRVLAHLCGDKALVDALTQSTDIHRAIAEVVFKKKPVSAEERSLAKRVVFGMLYGAGPKTLAAHMGVNVERALHITSLLTNAFPGIESYHRRVIEESRANGFVRTISGRLRYLPDIQSTVMARRSYAERQAFNSVVQGSAADVMKMAMLAVAKDVLQCYSRDDVRLLSQIHDEMVFSVRKELLPTLVPAVSTAMSHAMHLLVPLSVTVKFGPSLGDLKEWSVEHDLGLGVDG